VIKPITIATGNGPSLAVAMRRILRFLGGIVATAASRRDTAAAHDHGRQVSIVTTIDVTSPWVTTGSE
jgi:hypothetical protein